MNEHLAQISLEDLERIIHLLMQAGDPTAKLSLVERKRKLLESVAHFIDADIHIWSASVPDTSNNGDVMTSQLIEGGWASEKQRIQVFKALSNPHFAHVVQRPIVAAATAMEYVTLHRQDIMPDPEWAQVGEVWRQTGLDQMLLNIYPLSLASYSATAFHRQLGKPRFTERERTLVHLIFKQIEWFHRPAATDPSAGKLLLLSPRERQTLVLLLAGDTKREIGEKLGISEHTVGDYTKNIYKHFDVNSRAELQAFFMNGQIGD
jgi:DNA-binding CsgD family transcriptional regulator